jgi:hypothetical protein
VVELPFGRISVSLAPEMLQMNGSELCDFQPVVEIEVQGLRNRYRRPGIGAPLAAKTRPRPGVVPVIPVGPVVRVPLSAVRLIDSPLTGIRTGDLRARLELLPNLHEVLADRYASTFRRNRPRQGYGHDGVEAGHGVRARDPGGGREPSYHPAHWRVIRPSLMKHYPAIPFRIVAFCLVAFVPACSPKVQTRVDTGPIRAQTFAFVARNRPEPRSADDVEHVLTVIQEAITTNLAGKGVRRVESSPDVIVAYLLVIGDRTHTRVVDTYFGRGRLYGDLLNKAHEAYTNADNPTNLEAGTLLIDALDGRTAALLWRNHVTRTVLQNPSPELRAANIQGAVDEALRGLHFTR